MMNGESNLLTDLEIRSVVSRISLAVPSLGFLPYAVGALIASFILSVLPKLKLGMLPLDGANGSILNAFTVPGSPNRALRVLTTIFGGATSLEIFTIGQTNTTPSYSDRFLDMTSNATAPPMDSPMRNFFLFGNLEAVTSRKYCPTSPMRVSQHGINVLTPSDLPCPSYSIITTAKPFFTNRWYSTRLRKDTLSMYPWQKQITPLTCCLFLGDITDVNRHMPRLFVQ
mmetsp:Transcript_23421/g.30063  ORF Transcript_23421/g.30063 Transcript_23421/m.30063 type:complete len:227 (+) Transcript_23421:340-1020(+)